MTLRLFPKPPVYDWGKDEYPAADLRDYAKVLLDAVPRRNDSTDSVSLITRYFWTATGTRWHGCNPPCGAVPVELVRHIGWYKTFDTEAEAVFALLMAIRDVQGTSEDRSARGAL
jgi:hypothetical protein